MDDKYKEIIRQRAKTKDKQSEQYKESSKDRLQKIINKKMQTIMIGALASIEANLGFLWAHNERRKLTPEEQHMKDLYEKIRKEILDKGNAQGRNLATELEQYNVEWLRYQLTLPVIIESD